MSQALKIWKSFQKKPGGKYIFSRLLCIKIPYFSSISPLLETLAPDYCEVSMKKHNAVLNHLDTVHAIAICNLAELAAGTMTDASVPKTHSWILKGMQVEYIEIYYNRVRRHSANGWLSPEAFEQKYIKSLEGSIVHDTV